MSGSVAVLRGNAADLPLPDESVDLIVTSPPFWGLRDYKDGGQSLHGQVGAEETPHEYLQALWRCTREWIRVLKPDGSLFVNLGDKYSTYTGANWGNGRSLDGNRGPAKVPHGGPVNAPQVYGIPYKSLIGLPWRYALGCVGGGPALADPETVKLLLRDVALGTCTLADAEQVIDELAGYPAPGLGLILRAEIIWHKPTAMPESASDRVKRSHEHVFHFTKRQRYFAAVDEIREPHTMKPQRRPNGHRQRQRLGVLPAQTWSTSQRDEPGFDGHPLGKLPGSVWEIATVPLNVPERLAHGRCCGGRKRPGCEDGLGHHAAWPPELVRRIILGWSPAGICAACGQGRVPVSDRTAQGRQRTDAGDGGRGSRLSGYRDIARLPWTEGVERHITGYRCACPDTSAPARPAVVADPFGGTGTTALVASVLGRTGISVDLSHDYGRIAQWRTADPAERARALNVPKPPPVTDGQGSLFDESECT